MSYHILREMLFKIAIKILFSIYDNPHKAIYFHAKNTNCTYAYTHKVIYDFVKKDYIIKIIKTGRCSDIILTEKGEKIVKLYGKLRIIIDENDY